MKYTKLAKLINQCDWENAEKEFQIYQYIFFAKKSSL